MQEVLTIRVLCTETYRVEGLDGEAGMVFFEGSAEHSNFRGKVLPGGCDTQKHRNGVFSLSARYILEGTDCDNQKCHVFVENNGSTTSLPKDGVFHTEPVIFTDSKALRWMETAKLHGTVSPDGENRVLVRIFMEDSE